MQQPEVREGVATFLRSRLADSPFLLARWTPALETQFLVHEGSTQVEDADDNDETYYTDGEQVWFKWRWPHNAWASPFYRPKPLTFSPGQHLKVVGTTWWDWERKRSVAVAFDVDSAAGHKTIKSHDDEGLDRILEAAKALPYSTIVRSKSGKGFHVYIFFDPSDQPETANHTEHAALARYILDKMSDDSGFAFNAPDLIDVVGGMFWVWADEIGKGGFDLLKDTDAGLKASELGDWQSAVIEATASNRAPKIEGMDEGDTGRKIVGNFEIHALDDVHKAILKELELSGFDFNWKDKYNMAHTHTAAIQQLYERRKAEGKPLKGVFATISPGNDKKSNCYISPRPNGVFRVARHGQGATEHDLWESHEGDTWCYLNEDAPALNILRRFCDDDDGKTLAFKPGVNGRPCKLEVALNLLDQTLGQTASLITTNIYVTRIGTKFKARFEGLTDVEAFKTDGWMQKDKAWEKLLPLFHNEEAHSADQLELADRYFRHIATEQRKPVGWTIRTDDEFWMDYKSYSEIAAVVKQIFGRDAEDIHANMQKRPWRVIHEPFGSEYRGDRTWNKESPQLAFPASKEPGPHPTWDMLLDHLGDGLNKYITKLDWCSQWGIRTGGDYLRYWIACVVQYPFVPLPYLFFFGLSNSGKSTFYEIMNEVLFTRGVKDAGDALSSQAGFNAELAGAVVAYIDEKDLSMSAKQAWERIRKWTQAETLAIHPKGWTPYEQRNTLHFIQTGESSLNCPVEQGDTRLTVIEVPPLKHVLPKKKLFDDLRKEAPYFTHTLTTLQVPQQIGRTRLPIIETDEKRDIQKVNWSPLESFAAETLKPCFGAATTVADFYEAYKNHCISNNIKADSLVSIIRQLKNRSDIYLVGRYKNNQNYIGNVTMEKETLPSEALVLNDKGRLVIPSEG